jgi:hypothetical protein
MPRGTREEWAKRVERWGDSGLTAKEFAAETGINERTLTYWKWRLRPEAGRGERRSRRRPPAFLELVGPPGAVGGLAAPAVVSPATGKVGGEVSELLEVVLGNGRRIRVPVHFEADTLRRLVELLEGR